LRHSLIYVFFNIQAATIGNNIDKKEYFNEVN
jgi:hypothetical protein